MSNTDANAHAETHDAAEASATAMQPGKNRSELVRFFTCKPKWLDKEAKGDGRTWRATKRFSATFAAVGGVIGSYIATTKFGVQWIFWVAICGAGGVAILPPLFNGAVEVLKRVRTYPSLLKRVAEAEQQADSVTKWRISTHSAFTKGQIEGRAQEKAISLGAQLSVTPALVELSSVEGAALLIAAYPPEAPISTDHRFDVVTRSGRNRIGAVTVVLVDPAVCTAHLVCIDRLANKFWNELDRRSSHDFTPPENVELAQYTGPPFESEQTSDGKS